MNKKKQVFDIVVYDMMFLVVFSFLIYEGRFNAFGILVVSMEL